MTRTIARRKIINLLQTAVIMASVFLLLLTIAWLIAGVVGILLVCLLGVPALAFGGTRAAALVLRLYHARPIAPGAASALVLLVGELAARAGLDRPPALFYIPSSAPLAFSVGYGRDGAIALSDGLLRLLIRREIIGVLAHEISHIAGNDTRVMGVADLASRLTAAISVSGQLLVILNLPAYLLGGYALPWGGLLLMAVAPLLMTLLQLALSRTREFDADLSAVHLTGDPFGLANALERVEQQEHNLLRRLFIPYGTIEVPSVLRTHPATHRRVKHLRELAREWQRTPEGEFAVTDQSGRPLAVTVEPPGRSPRRRLSGLWY